jgi:TrmH family RNA methyltransferase
MIDKLERSTHKLRNAVRQLHRSSERADRSEFLVEGPNACLELLRAGVQPVLIIVSEDASEDVSETLRLAIRSGFDVYVASPSELTRMCTTSTSQGVMMVARMFDERACRGRVVALDGVTDPGNVGTIIRTAAWFGCTDLVLSDGCVDVYNPKVVRASAGALAALNIIRRPSIAGFLDEHPLLLPVIALAHDGAAPASVALPENWCLVVGSEAHGVSPELLLRPAVRVTIPGQDSAVESLNAAVAASIVLYALNAQT